MNPAPLILILEQLRGQRYRLIGMKPHQRQDGTMTELLVWESQCMGCGQDFTVTTSSTVNQYLTRRCPACIAKRREGG